MYTRAGLLGATLTLFHQICGDCMPRGSNVIPLFIDTNTSLVPAVSAVPIQICPVGPIVSASIHWPLVPAAVSNVQPPSRLMRRPSNVVAKIVPSDPIAYCGSHVPP